MANVVGGPGNDTLEGTDFPDRIEGLGGDDRLTGHAAGDIIDGGEGNDTVDYSLETGTWPGVYVNINESRSFSVASSFRLIGPGVAIDSHGARETLISIENVKTGSGDDIVYGSSGNNRIETGAGNDSLYGWGGLDTLIGGEGDDYYFVEHEGATIIENPGEGTDKIDVVLPTYTLPENVENLEGFYRHQTLIGNALDNIITHAITSDSVSHDILDGGAGADTLSGGNGNDIYYVDNPGDVVIEGSYLNSGIDEVRTWLASYALPANVENLTGLSDMGQTLTGNGLANVIKGAAGNDTLNGAAGNDTLHGGAGHDTLNGGADDDTLHGDAGNDTLNGGAGHDILHGGADDDTLNGDAGNDTLNGGDGQDTLNGGDGNDVLNGGAGDDVLNGGDGFDTLVGGAGADIMAGGAQNDAYNVDDAGDQVIELAGGGSDRVYASIPVYTLPSEVEALYYNGSGNFTGNGNDGHNQIYGAAGQDTLSGGAGNDTLEGRGGDDILYGGDGFDILYGGAGADIMVGGAHNDTYNVDHVGDQVIEFAGGGNDRVFVSLSSYVLPDEVEALSYNGTGHFTGTGNALGNQMIAGGGNDTLSGGGGNDVLDGRAGNDVLDGGTGTDTLTGGTGADIFRFQNGSTGLGKDADRITDFVSGTDRIDLSAMDADTTTAGDQAFTYIGALPFTGTAGELRYQQTGGNTWIEGDQNGDGFADFQIVLTGNQVPLATDFML